MTYLQTGAQSSAMVWNNLHAQIVVIYKCLPLVNITQTNKTMTTNTHTRCVIDLRAPPWPFTSTKTNKPVNYTPLRRPSIYQVYLSISTPHTILKSGVVLFNPHPDPGHKQKNKTSTHQDYIPPTTRTAINKHLSTHRVNDLVKRSSLCPTPSHLIELH